MKICVVSGCSSIISGGLYMWTLGSSQGPSQSFSVGTCIIMLKNRRAWELKLHVDDMLPQWNRTVRVRVLNYLYSWDQSIVYLWIKHLRVQDISWLSIQVHPSMVAILLCSLPTCVFSHLVKKTTKCEIELMFLALQFASVLYFVIQSGLMIVVM